MIETTGTRLRRVRLSELGSAERRAIVERSATTPPELRDRVRQIVEQVRTGGDAALRELNQRFGGGLPAPVGGQAPLSIDRSDLLRARDALPRDLRKGLEHMARNIERFHAIQVPGRSSGWTWSPASASDERGVAAAAPRGCVRARRWRGLPVVAADERHPGAPRGCPSSWWPPPPAATARSPLPCSARPG